MLSKISKFFCKVFSLDMFHESFIIHCLISSMIRFFQNNILGYNKFLIMWIILHCLSVIFLQNKNIQKEKHAERDI